MDTLQSCMGQNEDQKLNDDSEKIEEHQQDYKNGDKTKLRLKNKQSKTDDRVLERLELNDPITDYCNGLSFFLL